MLRTQHNAWIHLGATIAVVFVAGLLRISALEWAILVLAIAGVWSAEAFNTAVEAVGDAVSSRHDPMIGLAKDIAAGAVLIAALGALLVGVLVFGSRLFRLFGYST